MKIELNKRYVEDLIKRGEKIGEEEYHPSEDGFFPDYVEGPKYDIWMNEIYIFNERYLKHHPIYKCFNETIQNKKNSYNPYIDMMGYLKALVDDGEFWEEVSEKEKKITMKKRKPLEQLLAEDIDRCERFLENPGNNKDGVSLYTEITSRYDSIIENFGNGLYQYYPEQHFYDPEIGGKALFHNLKVLHERMITYLASQSQKSIENTNHHGNSVQDRLIFLSHKSDDRKYGDALRSFIIGLGVKDEQLIYTSHPLNKIPMDENIYEYLRKHINSQVFMIILWSDKYLDSPACLNEMGAAWVTQADYTNIYVPDFSFGSKYHECAVDTSKMGAVLNGDAICKASMIELKNKIVKMFDLTVAEEKTNYLLDQFIESIKGERYKIINCGTFGDN